jgi:hypothetical protein
MNNKKEERDKLIIDSEVKQMLKTAKGTKNNAKNGLRKDFQIRVHHSRIRH